MLKLRSIGIRDYAVPKSEMVSAASVWPPNACCASGSEASPSTCAADCPWVRPRIATRLSIT